MQLNPNDPSNRVCVSISMRHFVLLYTAVCVALPL